jgi:hypothetical protein
MHDLSVTRGGESEREGAVIHHSGWVVVGCWLLVFLGAWLMSFFLTFSLYTPTPIYPLPLCFLFYLLYLLPNSKPEAKSHTSLNRKQPSTCTENGGEKPPKPKNPPSPDITQPSTPSHSTFPPPGEKLGDWPAAGNISPSPNPTRRNRFDSPNIPG